MSLQSDAFARHQQARWMKPDAARWVRPDAARFLRPGKGVRDAFPALASKYNPNQPRVPSGNGIESGRWSSGESSSGRPRVYITTSRQEDAPGDVSDSSSDLASTNPMGSIDFGDISAELRALNLFGTATRELLRGLVRIAGDLPRGIGDNGGPPLEEPPDIPQRIPKGSGGMKFVRNAVHWLGKVGRYSPIADAFFAAADQFQEINRLTDMIRSANDPPRELDELIERAQGPSRPGYHKHHLAEQEAARKDGYPESVIQRADNIVSVPHVKHLDITAEYQRIDLQPDGTVRSLREYLRGRDFETRQQIGRAILRKHGVLK